MYCILVTGIPASGKSTMAEYLSEALCIPMLSKDKIKEILFDTIGFHSRAEKVALGTGAMEIMYYFAEQMMKTGQSFILENNFENVSKPGIQKLLSRYGCQAVTVRLSGDDSVLYKRMARRNDSPDRHMGHIVNDCYPRPEGETGSIIHPVPAQEDFIRGITERGMVDFRLPGPLMEIDTTDFSKVNLQNIAEELRGIISHLSLSENSSEEERRAMGINNLKY